MMSDLEEFCGRANQWAIWCVELGNVF